MTSSVLLVVLPTLGDRLNFLETTLRSCQELARKLPTTVAMVAPIAAKEARALGAKYGATLVDDPCTGLADAVNAGIATRTFEDFYVWVGDDDELVPAGIVTLLKTLEASSSAVVAYGQCDYVDDLGSRIGRSKAGNLAKWLLTWGPNLIPHPGTLIRLEALNYVGAFDSNLRYALDLDVFLKLRSVGDFIAVPTVTARFRWHAGSATVADRSASSREAVAVKKKYLPSPLRALSWIWNYPVAWVSQIAAWLVTLRARHPAS